MARNARRIGTAVAAVGTAAGLALAAAPTSSADSGLTLHQKAKVTTYVAKPGKTVTFTGTQAATIDFSAPDGNNLSAALKLNPSTMKVDIPLVRNVLTLRGVATATLQIEPVGDAKGNLDLATLGLDVTQKFNVHITKLTPPVFSFINLVPSTCKTSTPASMHLTGKLTNLSDPFTLTSTYTIPSFKGCGLLTPLITSLTSGGGNTVSATFTPTTS